MVRAAAPTDAAQDETEPGQSPLTSPRRLQVANPTDETEAYDAKQAARFALGGIGFRNGPWPQPTTRITQTTIPRTPRCDPPAEASGP